MAPSGAMRWARTAALGAAVAGTPVFTNPARAQTPLVEGSTIHVYTNLMQIPVLVLDRHRRTLPPLPSEGFLVRLGKDAPFHPRLVRQEGEDPITLAILLDGAEHDSLLSVLPDALVAMASEQLLPHDRVAIYAMDGCKLRRLSALVPVNVATVRDSTSRAAAFAPYSAAHQGACGGAVPLWDATNYLVHTLSGEPGRRVILAVTNGNDGDSRTTPDALRRSANQHGVTVFALAERFRIPQRPPQQSRNLGWEVSSDLAEVAEGSGGMVVEVKRTETAAALQRFVELVRGRYILEFQRPSGLSAGTNSISVTCGQPHAFVRTAGTSVPIADPVATSAGVEHGAPTAPLDR